MRFANYLFWFFVAPAVAPKITTGTELLLDKKRIRAMFSDSIILVAGADLSDRETILQALTDRGTS